MKYTVLSSDQSDQNFIGIQVVDSSCKIIGGAKGYINTAKGEKAQIIIGPSDSSNIQIRIYDLTDTLIWETSKELATANVEIIEWNGRNVNDEPVSSGIYLVHVEGGINKITKVAIIK